MKYVGFSLMLLMTQSCYTAQPADAIPARVAVDQESLLAETKALILEGKAITERAQQYPELLQTDEFKEFTRSLANLSSHMTSLVKKDDD